MLKKVLIVEDSSLQAKMYRAVFGGSPGCRMVFAQNGLEAMDQLVLEKDIELIILDINMPKMNGIELLTLVKTDPDLQKIPAVMLTTSTNDRDIIQSFHLSAAGYMIKPVDYKQFVETIRTIDTYWRLSRIPKLV